MTSTKLTPTKLCATFSNATMPHSKVKCTFLKLFFHFPFSTERAPADHWPHIYWFRHEQNHLYHPKCTDREFLKRREFCGNPKYLDGICTALPIQVTKLDRINLKFMVPLLTDEEIGSRTKILYLVRDPRAVYLSRKDFPWCVASPECIEPKYLCRDMVQDFHEAQKAAKWSPDQFM